MKVENISVWAGCDPFLAEAINSFSERWRSYSIESRRYSIFRLIRELIDDPWNDLQDRFPSLKIENMDRAWSKYQIELKGDPEFENDDKGASAQVADRLKAVFAPCAAKIDGQYVFSVFAKNYGFTALDRFLQLVDVGCGHPFDATLTASFSSLRELAIACRSKKSDRQAFGNINARRAHLRSVCRLCGQTTELSMHIDGKPWPMQDGNLKLHLSSMYCDKHKPREAGTVAVRSNYLKVKRNQSQFDLEYSRLDRQGWGDPLVPRAKSGNWLIDEYIRRVAARRLQSFSFDVVRYILDQEYFSMLDQTLRDEARLLVDRAISDRKKEMMMLLASGLSQTGSALRLGIQRQAVSKALPFIDSNWRLDLWTSETAIGCDRAAPHDEMNS